MLPNNWKLNFLGVFNKVFEVFLDLINDFSNVHQFVKLLTLRFVLPYYINIELFKKFYILLLIDSIFFWNFNVSFCAEKVFERHWFWGSIRFVLRSFTPGTSFKDRFSDLIVVFVASSDFNSWVNFLSFWGLWFKLIDADVFFFFLFNSGDRLGVNALSYWSCLHHCRH